MSNIPKGRDRVLTALMVAAWAAMAAGAIYLLV
jgi:hypothetical protein